MAQIMAYHRKPAASTFVQTNALKDKNAEIIVHLFDRETFETNRRLWLEQGLQNYSFDVCLMSYSGPFWAGRVTVKNGVLDGFIPDQQYGHFSESAFSKWPEFRGPIPDIYDAISALRDQMEDPAWRAEVCRKKGEGVVRHYFSQKVEYNNTYHYPRYFVHSYSASYDQPVTGNGLVNSISISRFVINETEP